MIYLIWALLNISIWLFFVYLSMVAATLIRKNMGRLVAVFFLGGVLISMTHREYPKSGKEFSANSVHAYSGGASRATQYVELDKSLINRHEMSVSYYVDQQNNAIPVKAQLNIMGFTSGISWESLNLDLKSSSGNKIAYYVYGIEYWSLFGVRVYSRPRTFTGIMIADKR